MGCLMVAGSYGSSFPSSKMWPWFYRGFSSGGSVDERQLQAAKETETLQAAKTKLEKQVEELTWQLQQEKRTRVDIEEAKANENAKLQSSLQEMQLQFQETKELLIKEHEAAKKDVEPIHVIKEVPIMDQEMIINLTAENEKLKVLIKEHEAAKKDVEPIHVIKEVPVMYQEMINNLTAENEKLKVLIKEHEAAKKNVEPIHVIKEVPVMYQEMINNLTAENEKLKVLIKEHEAAKKDVEPIHVIKEVPVMDQEMINNLTAENEKLKALVSSLEKKIDETENKYEETNKLSEERLKQALEAETKIIQLKTDMQRLEEKLSDMEAMDQILRHQALMNSPATKMLDHLDSERTQPVENGYHETQSASPAKKFGTASLRRSQIERQHENVDSLIKCVRQDLGFSHGKPIAAFTIYKCLLHWRSFEAERTSVFDRLIQMIGSAIENQDRDDYLVYWLSNTSVLLFLLQRTLKATSATPGKPPAPTSFFGRMTQGFRSSPSSANLSFRGLEVHQVEAKYPALLFKQQLTAYVEKIYGIVRDNMKKDLSPLLSSCIQAPRASKGNALRSSGRSFGNSPSASHWRSIVQSLNGLLSILKENFVPPILCQKMFTQIFCYINVQIFNSLLLRRECCTFDNGEYVKAGLAELELWCGQVKEEYAGSSWDELKHIRQAVGFLVHSLVLNASIQICML
ncbi:hypothetical protein RHSIM_Rhsim05G0111100 [Rhododendron simsii]|uniref:Dilute domain-containing protein n=1 Tax=Rhododendron simsii TaxID=118357 RepID=A0A834GZP4_RHOSS|nr:hypothetical protein RHSIM_Rhsim05G0111100 [Rhododendron simsii]